MECGIYFLIGIMYYISVFKIHEIQNNSLQQSIVSNEFHSIKFDIQF